MAKLFLTDYAIQHHELSPKHGYNSIDLPFDSLQVSAVNSDGEIEVVAKGDYQQCNLIGFGDSWRVLATSFSQSSTDKIIKFVTSKRLMIYQHAFNTMKFTDALSIEYHDEVSNLHEEVIRGSRFYVKAGRDYNRVQFSFVSDDVFFRVVGRLDMTQELIVDSITFSGFGYEDYQNLIMDWLVYNAEDIIADIHTVAVEVPLEEIPIEETTPIVNLEAVQEEITPTYVTNADLPEQKDSTVNNLDKFFDSPSTTSVIVGDAEEDEYEESEEDDEEITPIEEGSEEEVENVEPAIEEQEEQEEVHEPVIDESTSITEDDFKEVEKLDDQRRFMNPGFSL